MTSFIMKKKKFKFQVNLELVELSSVPLVNAVLFVKVRLLDGGNFSQSSSRVAVQDHLVHWGQKFTFNSKMSANVQTGVLEPCMCRISVRKELKGGKSYMKCGFVNINLAEYAGSGSTTRRYLLEEYDSRHRQDNSILKVSIEMTLLSGDPLFKVPDVKGLPLPGEVSSDPSGITTLSREEEANKGGNVMFYGSGSLTTAGLLPSPTDSDTPATLDDSFEQGHSRTSSYNSQQSKASGYSSGHSNSSSNPEHFSSATSLTDQVTDKEKEGTPRDSWQSTAERRRRHAEEAQRERRVDDSRVDADEVIKGIISQQDFSGNVGEEGTGEEGLQLFIAKDGSTALGSNQLKSRMSAGTFKQVVIDKR